jgi:translation initiation factor IF-2
VIRNSIVIFPKKEGVNGELSSLKRHKDNVAEVRAGFECGLTVKNFDDFKEGDEIEVYELKEVKQKLS